MQSHAQTTTAAAQPTAQATMSHDAPHGLPFPIPARLKLFWALAKRFLKPCLKKVVEILRGVIKRVGNTPAAHHA
ncbi:hypothetical protein H4R33_000279 [Dimargaris cristalligena]|nr:hypothetical protein H4R33_000279 [Dimargaris cristalligena]